MLKKIANWLVRKSTGPVAALGLVIFVLFMLFVLPGQTRSSTDETGTPDLSFRYSTDDLYTMAEAYGAQGRQEYVRVRFTFDLAWPLVYGFFLVTTIGWLYGRAFPQGSIWWMATLAPVLAVLFDFLENISTSVVMARFPARTVFLPALATVVTPVKWILVGVSFGLLVLGSGLALWARLRRQP